MKLLLLGLLLSVSAHDLHEHMYTFGCSDNDADKEDMDGVDGEVLAYADFDKKEEIYAQPSFMKPVHFAGTYEHAVENWKSICQFYLPLVQTNLSDLPLKLDPPGPPLVYPRDQLVPDQPNTLVCQASGFYPAPVRFFWTKDQENMTSTAETQPYPQADGSFTQFSRLEVSLKNGQVYSCSLEHPGLGPGQRVTCIWTVEMRRPALGPSVFCAVGLILGLVGVVIGTIFLVKGCH